MSSTSKITIAVVVVILIIFGIWYVMSQGTSSAPVSAEPSTTASQTATPESGLTTSSSDSSDAALAQDAASINGQMRGLGSDSAAVNQSLSTQ